MNDIGAEVGTAPLLAIREYLKKLTAFDSFEEAGKYYENVLKDEFSNVSREEWT
jgi:hypothetical protein